MSDDGLDVERLLSACSRVGLELFPLHVRAIVREYESLRLAAENEPDWEPMWGYNPKTRATEVLNPHPRWEPSQPPEASDE